MPRKPSQQARFALKCNPGEGTQANKKQQSAHRGAALNTAHPQAHRASRYATRAETTCRMSLSDGCLSLDPGIQQGGTPCVNTGGYAQRPRGVPGLWSEPQVRCSAVQWSAAGPSARAAFMASPLKSVGKGGLQGGEASPPRTKPIRRAWNGQPVFATAKCPCLPPVNTRSAKTCPQAPHAPHPTYREAWRGPPTDPQQQPLWP
jgi:hypothetical protein